MNLIFKFQLHILNTESKIWFLTNFRSRSEKEDDTSNDDAIDDDINWAENFKSLAGILIEILVFHQRFEILCTIYVFIDGILILISLNKVNFRLYVKSNFWPISGRDLKKEDDTSDEEDDDAIDDDINRAENFKSLAGNLIEIDLKLTDFGFGLALAGHTNRNRMGTFICGINPKGAAFENGQLKVGDELLKVYIF